jgi:hypothetical protein
LIKQENSKKKGKKKLEFLKTKKVKVQNKKTFVEPFFVCDNSAEKSSLMQLK